MKIRKLSFLLALLLVVLLAACGASAPEPSPEETDSSTRPSTNEVAATEPAATPMPAPGLPTPFPPTPTLDVNQPTPTPEARLPQGTPGIEAELLVPQESAPYPVAIAMDSEETVQGTYYPAFTQGAPALLLLHMWGGDREVWRGLALQAQEQGLAVLAVDLHGHGETGGPRDVALMKQDVAAALDWLASETAPAAMAVVGAGSSANLALEVAAGRPSISGIALISPLPEGQMDGLALAQPLSEAGSLSLFVAVAAEDAAAASGESLAALPPAALHVYEGAEHGTNLLQRQDQLRADLLQWAAEVLAVFG